MWDASDNSGLQISLDLPVCESIGESSYKKEKEKTPKTIYVFKIYLQDSSKEAWEKLQEGSAEKAEQEKLLKMISKYVMNLLFFGATQH